MGQFLENTLPGSFKCIKHYFYAVFMAKFAKSWQDQFKQLLAILSGLGNYGLFVKDFYAMASNEGWGAFP